ncbi:MAG: flavodoxin family protein [Pseudomonadota bacterium]
MSERILVINGSPRADRGITSLVINHFLQGCHELGANSEIIHVAKSDLATCDGELACFFKTDRTCLKHTDDQGTEFIEKWIQADRILLASPLHFNSVSSYFIRFLERLLCTVEPFYTENAGYPTHKGPFASKPSAVIGVCAYPGVFNFNLFKEVMLNYQRVFWLEPGGNILLPMSRDYSVLTEKNPRYSRLLGILDRIRQAGREFMQDGEISLETEDQISADTDDFDTLIQEQTAYFARLYT